MWTGENGAFRNADVQNALGFLGITRGQFAYLFSLIGVRMSNIVIEYGISLLRSEFRMSHGNIFENAPRVDRDLFLDG